MSGNWAWILLVICLVAILVIGVVVLLIWKRRAHAEAREASFAGRWNRAAESIGMKLDPCAPHSQDPRIMRGRLRDVNVTALWHLRVEGSSEDQDVEMEVSAAISPPMRLGIQLFGVGSRWQRSIEARFGAQDIEVGIPALDQPFIIRGFSEEVVTSFLGGHQTQAFVKVLCRPANGMDILVNDREVQIMVRGFVGSPDGLYYLVDFASFLAHAATEARAWVPLQPWESGIATAWQRLATKLGMQLNQGQLSLTGEMTGMPVHVWLDHHEGNWCTAIEVSFPRPLREHVHLFAKGELLALRPLAGLRDVVLGDFQFDQEFVVQGLRQEGVARLLPPRARQQLIQQREKSVDVVLQTHRLVVHANGVLSDPGILEERLREVVVLATEIMSA